jgi:hypothetical protein
MPNNVLERTVIHRGRTVRALRSWCAGLMRKCGRGRPFNGIVRRHLWMPWCC